MTSQQTFAGTITVSSQSGSPSEWDVPPLHPAQRADVKKTIVDSSWNMAASVGTQLIGMATALALRRLILPADMGVWQAAKLWISYSNYTNLGASKAAIREYNLAKGRGVASQAFSYLSTAHTVNVVTSSLFAVILACWGIYYATSSSERGYLWGSALAASAAIVMLNRYNTFHISLLRAQKRFAVAARIALLEGMATLAVCVSLVLLAGVWGLIVGSVIVMLGLASVHRQLRTVPLKLGWSAADAKKLISAGTTMMLCGLLFQMLRTVDRLAILFWHTNAAYALGCYSVSYMVTGQVFGIGGAIGLAFLPRIVEFFGSNGSCRGTVPLALMGLEFQLLAVAAASIGALLVVPTVLCYLLPEYRPGVPALLFLLPAMPALTSVHGSLQFMISTKQERKAAILLAMLVGLALAGTGWTVWADGRLTSLATTTASVFNMAAVLMLVLGVLPCADWRLRVHHIVVFFLVTAAAIFASCGVVTEEVWKTQIPWRVGLLAAAVVAWATAFRKSMAYWKTTYQQKCK